MAIQKRGDKFHLLLLFVIVLFIFFISSTQYTISTSSPPIAASQEQHQTKYLAYLPHSGLSNQRIELSNALMLAYMLNRTLIIPPAFLGNVFGWMPRDRLEDKLEWLTTPNTSLQKACSSKKAKPGTLSKYIQRAKCAEFRQFAAIPWTELHDLDNLCTSYGIQFVLLKNAVSMDTFQRQFNITTTYFHNDTQLYDWRLFEDQTVADHLINNQLNYFDSFAGRRYYQVLSPRHFLDRPEQLLYLGGIFGSTRLNLSQKEHITIQYKIRQALRYRMDTYTPLGQTVQAILDYLGGSETYMSVHFRTADKPFKKEVPQNLDTFMRNMTLLVQNQDSNLTHCNIKKKAVEQHVYHETTSVYMATDHFDPRASYSPLLPWFDMFPCTTLLKDLPHSLFVPLEKIKDSVAPSKPLKKFLLPIVDAMVAAHGKEILTTPRSTFSKYIEELHQAWTVHNDIL